LAYREGNDLKLHIEQVRPNCDLFCLAQLTNEVYSKVLPGLEELKIKTGKTEAFMSTGYSGIKAEIPHRLSGFKSEVKNKKSDLIFKPLALAIIFVSCLQLKKENNGGVINNAVFQFIVSYLAILLAFLADILFKKKSRKFDFKFPQ